MSTAATTCSTASREISTLTAIANGLARYGGLIPYTATFLVFSDYARNAIRMAALVKQRQVMGLHAPFRSASARRRDATGRTMLPATLIPGCDVTAHRRRHGKPPSPGPPRWNSARTARACSLASLRQESCRRSPPAFRPTPSAAAALTLSDADGGSPGGADRHRLPEVEKAGARRAGAALRPTSIAQRRPRVVSVARRRIPDRQDAGLPRQRARNGARSRVAKTEATPTFVALKLCLASKRLPSSASTASFGEGRHHLHPFSASWAGIFGFTVANVAATVKGGL